MAKDPAFLFYPADFMTGTQFFSLEQRGMYISLLCAQHMNGHLKEKHMLIICGSYDEDVFNKFKKDGEGLYFNEVLETHIEKRKAFTESRRNNRLGKTKEVVKGVKPSIKPPKIVTETPNNISLTYDNHMENENVNVIEDKKAIAKQKKIKDLEDKLKNAEVNFIAEAELYIDDYGAEMIAAFCNHWCERTRDKKELKFNREDTFEIKRRLVKWADNNAKWSTDKRTGSLKPAGGGSKLEAAEDRVNDILKDYTEDGQ